MQAFGPPICTQTCLVGRMRQFVYAYVPKAACTSLKLWMATVEGLLPEGGVPNVPGGVHAFLPPICALDRMPAGHAHGILKNHGWFKFAFVRNPLSRLVSAYLDKVVPAKPTAAELIRRGQQGDKQAAWWQRLLGRVRIDKEKSLTFRQLARQLLRERPDSLDEHFRPQHLLLAGLPLDFVGKVENIAADFAAVQRRLDTNVALAHKKQQAYAGADGEFVADWPASAFRDGSPHPHWRRFYSPEVLANVFEFYREDFVSFSYRPVLDVYEQRPIRKAA
jgi:hypothetical protein